MNASEIPKMIKRGRPPKLENFDRKAYNKSYYEKNKENTKGTYFCNVCNVICSKSNKSRHNKGSLHQSCCETTLCDIPPPVDEFIKELNI